MTNPIFPDLKDSVVFITGGGSGIGAGFVSAFAAQGAKVAFVSLTPEPAERLCAEIAQAGHYHPLFIPCDIRNIDALQAAITQVEAEMGSIDVLINNAARDDRHQLEDYDANDWDDSINTNLRPHFFTAQSVAKSMKEKGGGSIINVGSNSALLGLSSYPTYVAAKAAIMGLSKALARELGTDNIRVNTLIPGWVMTERQKKLWATPEAVTQCLDQQCLKSMISEEDVANLALFLGSSASKMITGQSMIIDAGRS